MSPVVTVLLVILVIVIIALVVLYFWGNKMQAQQAEQQALLEQMKQTLSILVIDKKKMPLKDADLPAQAKEQTPWYARRMKVNVVKAKIQNRIMVLLADEIPFEQLVLKKEAKVVISGIYITKVLSIRGAALKQIPEKQGIRARITSWVNKTREKLKNEEKESKKK